MVRRSVGFVSKKPHQKSRAGCLTCKRKKVKCDEGQPSCGYCALRKLECDYQQDTPSKWSFSSSSSSASSLHTTVSDEELNRNEISTPICSWIVPAAHSSAGKLTPRDLELLHQYKTSTWRTLVVHDEPTVMSVHKDTAPQLALSHSHLLYALLSIAASDYNALHPCKQMESQALVYRQKTFTEYSKSLQNITAANYESIVITSLYLVHLIPPGDGSPDSALDEMNTILSLNEGVRILAGSRWAKGIEKLSIYPLLRRELRTLPPPPVISTRASLLLLTPVARLGTTPIHPNPPSTYYLEHSDPSPVFLPPPLAALLASISDPAGPASSGEHRDALIPVFHILGPIFLSLYYYHLDPDVFVRIRVFCSFLMPDFLRLVRLRESKSLVLIAWWYSLAGLAPMGWWLGGSVRRMVEAVGFVVREGEDELAKRAFEGSERIVQLFEVEGREAAARSVFENWPGVDWGEGPQRAKEWEMGLISGLGELSI